MKPIYVTVVGSRLYGIAKEDSDYDIKGLGFGEVDEYCGMKKKEQVDYSNGKDGKDSYNGTVYEIRRCFQLLLTGNPTVIEPFFAEPKFVLHTTEVGEIVAKFVRENMISKHFFKPYFYYHRDQITEFTNSKREGKRKELFEKYGFDGKFAAHGYRLAKQCVGLMKTGTLNPTIVGEDQEVIMKMRNYEYSKEECLAFLTKNIAEMDEAFANSTIPESVDREKVNAFVSEVVLDYLAKVYLGTEHLIFGDKQFDVSKYPL